MIPGIWTTSSFSLSHRPTCAEVRWRTSSLSRHPNKCLCVEVGPCACGDTVLVRDSKDPSGPVLSFTGAEWRAFLSRVRR